MNMFQSTAPPTSPSGPGQAKKSTTKRMFRAQMLAAVVLAAVVGVLLYSMLNKEEDGVYVFVAKQSLAVRSPVSEASFVAMFVPLESVAEGAYVGATPEELYAKSDLRYQEADAATGAKPGDPKRGLTTQYPVAKGTQLVRNMISVEKILDSPMGPEDRLISITATPGAAVSGRIRVGDHVDIYAVAAAGGDQGADDGAAIINMVANDVEVVGVSVDESALQGVTNSQAEAAKAGGAVKDREELLPADPVPALYTLRVNQDLAPRLLLASDHTVLYLSLRPAGATTKASQPVPLAEIMCAVTQSNEGIPPLGLGSASCDAIFAGAGT